MRLRLLCLVGFYALLGTSCSSGAGRQAAVECTRNGVCDDGIYCNGEERCEAGKCVSGEPIACDDGIACTTDSCDETRWACRHEAPDADSDGHTDAACLDARSRPLGDDCDDADAARHPGADEFCDPNGVDEDCDASTVGDKDDDGDGAVSAACCNVTEHERQCGPDCDDTNPQVGPEATEVCDGLDNNCDGRTDEGVELRLFRDLDGDQYGSGEVALRACAKVRGYSSQGGDCDDHDAAVHPGAPESCAMPAADRDCNGVKNDIAGGCACKSGTERPCPLAGLCSQGTQACVNELWSPLCSIVPVAETCNGLDDDCDGQTDNSVTIDCYADDDADGFAPAGASSMAVCPTVDQADGCPLGFTHRAPNGGAVDCAPKDSSVSPGASELCNGKDDDCDGDVDEGLALTQRFVDNDGDGHAGTAVQRCATDPNSQSSADDCMDDNPLVYPGQAGVFSSPACGHGFVPCLAGSTDWHCKIAGSDGCDAKLAAAQWDYDCDGKVTGDALVSDPCVVANTCGGGCGPSGFVSAGSGASNCGITQAYQVCRCLGAQGGGCTGATEQHPYTCH